VSADRHLLFGLLALQNEFIEKKALVAAFGIWVADRSKSLDQILVENAALSDEMRLLLNKLVDQHVRVRGEDLQASLNAISGDTTVRKELEKLADADLHASLIQLKTPDLFATVSVGQSTSQGTRFEIRRPLDRGGLGIVSVAIDKELNREVALKEIRTDCADDRGFREKFLQEAEVTGRLEHPNIVPVYGLGTYADGRPYYAMRLIQGDNLREHIKLFHQEVKSGKERFDGPALRKLLRRFLDVCQAIDYAHARGILHRDLKPGNVMLGKYGETLVVDWGLAKAVQPSNTQSSRSSQEIPLTETVESPLIPSSRSTQETVQGSILGTAAYAPPEQLSGKLSDIGVRSDVYGLGAILYELVTGRAPGLGATLEETIQNVVRGRIPPPRSIASEVPEPLEAICMKAISLQPSDRYASANELQMEAERWLDDLPVGAYREPFSVQARRWIRSHQTLATTGSAMVLMATVGLGLFSSFVSQSNTRLASLNSNLDSKNQELTDSNIREREVSAELNKRRGELEQERLALLLRNGYLACENGRLDAGLSTMVQVLRTAVLTKNSEVEGRVRRLLAAWSMDHTFSFPVATASIKYMGKLPQEANFNTISTDGRVLAYSSSQEEPQSTIVNVFSLETNSLNTSGPTLAPLLQLSVTALQSNLEIFDDGRFLTFSDNGKLTLCQLNDKSVTKIDIPETLLTGEEQLHLIKFSESRNRLVALSEHSVQEFDIVEKKWFPIRDMTPECGTPLAFALTASEPLTFAVASPSGVFVASSDAASEWKTLSRKEAYSVDFSQNGYLFAGGARDKDKKNPTMTGWYQGWAIADTSNISANQNLPLSNKNIEDRSTIGNVSIVRAIPQSPSIVVASGANFFGDAPSQLKIASLETDSLERSVASIGSEANIIATGLGKVGRGNFVSIAFVENANALLWRVGIRTRLLAQETLNGNVTCASFDANGEKLFIGLRPSNESKISIEWRNTLDLKTHGTISTRRLGSVRALAYSGKKNLLVWTGDSTGTFSVTGEKLNVISRTTGSTQRSSVAFVNNEEHVAIVEEEDTAWLLGSNPAGQVSIINVQNGNSIRDLKLSNTIVQSLAVGPSSALIAGSSDNQVRHWNSVSGSETKLADHYESPIRLLVANESSPIYGVATTDGGLHIRYWDESSKPAVVVQHTSRIESACVNEEGTLVATGCSDGSVQLWDTRTGERIGPPMQHKSPVTAVAISPGSSFLFTGAGDQGHIWEVPKADVETVDSIAARIELLTGASVDENGNSKSLTYQQRLERAGNATGTSEKKSVWPEMLPDEDFRDRLGSSRGHSTFQF
jgi:serine/threonine protein kinase